MTARARFASKTVIVTGGSSGFGAAIATSFAREGAAVVIADINAAGARDVIAAFDAAQTQAAAAHASSADHPPGTMVFVETDVTREESWAAVVQFAVDRHGGVDVVVNNAGTTYRNKPTLEVTSDEFDRVFNVNVKSIFWSLRAFLPQALARQSGGVVINIASIGATRPRPGLVWYNASKAAVWNATKGLAAEYGPQQIRVNAICPLLSGTGLFESFVGVPDTPENRNKFLSNVPLGRLCEPQNVADACLFLASEDGGFITGACLEVDGGRSTA